MTLQAVLLYGSKARKDGAEQSDTDLLGISPAGRIEKYHDDNGVSFHVYPLPWMLKSSAEGSLFLLHISQEAVALFDPANLLSSIRSTFAFKLSYRSEIEAGIRILLAVEKLKAAEFSTKVRSRYFWAIRTALIGAAADDRKPSFSAQSLESFSRINGLARHIQNRQTATFWECRAVSVKVRSYLSTRVEAINATETEDNLDALFNLGGVAAAAAGEIIYGL